jgi:hypothetical protein
MSEGQGGQFDQKFPELRQEELHEVVPNLHSRVRTAVGLLNVVDITFGSGAPAKQKELTRSNSVYDISNVATVNEDEIIIEKHSELGRPNLAGETLRFQFGNPAYKDTVLIEYSRALRKGGIRTYRNNLIALRYAEKFIAGLERDFQKGRV